MSRRDTITLNLFSAAIVGAVVVGMFALAACSVETPAEAPKAQEAEKVAPIPPVVRFKDGLREDVRSAVVIDKATGCEYIATYDIYGGGSTLTIRYGQNGTIMCPTRVIVQPDGTEVPV